MRLDPVQRLKDGLKNGLRILGLDVRRASAMPTPPPLCSDPLEVVSRRYSHDHVALRCPLTECVTFNAFSLSPKGWHPFVSAGRAYVERGVRRYEGSPLEHFFASWQPRHALEALNGNLAGPRALEGFPAFTVAKPWSPKSFEECTSHMSRVIEIENRSIGNIPLGPDDGYGLQGPVSAAKGRLELQRLTDLIDSIGRTGYSRRRGDVIVEILHRAGAFKYMVVHGHHRAAALLALGHTHIPAIPQILVEREHVDHWPGVYLGRWSRDEALAYFDHLFDFDSATWAREQGLEP